MDNLLRCCVFLCLYRHHVTSSTTIQNLQLEEFFEDVFPPQLDVCDTEDFEAECPLHHVIFVRSALYGRMELGRCVEHAFGYVGCFRDVLVLADRRCSGRTGCTIHVPNAEFENTRPCLKELKSFLRVSYDCVRVENVTKEKCEQNPWLLLRPEQNNFPETTVGFIASIVTAEEAECADKPWFIQVQTGQRINLTLFDFSTGNQHKQANNFNQTSEDFQSILRRKLSQVHHSNCQEYAVVEDGEKKFAVCGGEGQRVAWTYLSVEHQVKVWVTAGMAQNDMRRFILQYEVVGCPDPFLTDRVWFRKISNNQATSGCIDSPQSWKLECFDQVWRPQVEQHPVNCSATTPENLTKRDEDHVEGTAYFSLTVTAIFFILVALVVSLTCLIRHYRKLVAQEGKEEDISKSKDSSDQHLDLQQQQQQQQIQSDPQQHIQLLQTKLYNISNRSLCGQKFLNEGISSVSFSVPSNQLTASQLTPQFRLVTSPTSSRLKRGEHLLHKNEHLLHADNLRFVDEPNFTNIRNCQKSTTLF